MKRMFLRIVFLAVGMSFLGVFALHHMLRKASRVDPRLERTMEHVEGRSQFVIDWLLGAKKW